MVLSILVSFAVPLSLMMPAISMTADEIEQSEEFDVDLSDLTLMSDQPTIESDKYPLWQSPPGNAVNFGEKIISVAPGSLNGGSGDSVTAEFTVTYDFGTSSGVGYANGAGGYQPYIYYTLPEEITVPENYSGDNFTISDDTKEWAEYRAMNGLGDSKVSGHYSIDKENGLIVITFTDDYLMYLDEKGNIFQGTLKFNGTVNRKNDADGDQIIKIGGQKITVQFDDKNVTVGKSAYKDNSDPLLIHWRVTVNNPGKYKQLNGHTLTDEMFGKQTSFTTDPTGVGTLSGNTFTFNSDADQYEQIIFNYTTKVTEAELKALTDGNVRNEATLNIDNVEPGKSSVWYDTGMLKATLSKSGRPSYEINGDRDYIEWEVTVSRQNDFSLKGYVVQDEMLKNYTTIEVKDADGNVITNSVSIDQVNGKATINTDTDYVTIKYRTPASNTGGNDSGTYTNKATVTPPGEDTPDDTKEIPVYYNDKSLFTVSKGNSGFDEKSESITWTITVDTASNNAGTLNGYTISDEMFARLSGGLTNAYITQATNNGSNVSNVSFTAVSGKDNTYMINGDVDHLVITYTLPLTDAEKASRLNLTNGNSLPIRNDVDVTDDDDNKKSDDETVYVPALVDTLNKQLKSTNYESEKGSYDYVSPGAAGTTETRDLKWQVTMDQYRGLSGGSKAYIDVLSATGDGEHYILPSQVSNIKVTAQKMDGTSKVLTSGTDYTIQFYSDESHTQEITNFTGDAKAKSYVITFLESVDNEKYVHLTIDYNTTADVTNVKNGSSSVFSNSASFGNQSSPGNTFTFERTDPTEVPKINVAVSKSWADDDNNSLNSRHSVSVQLQQKCGENGTWDKYQDYTLTADSNGNYFYTWNDLPQRTADASETPYYYRVVELDSNGNPVEDGGTVGDYTVSYENLNGINNTGTLTIRNTWNKLNIGVVKKWDGGSAENRPSSIEVKLQQKTSSDTDWTDVANAETKTLTFDTWQLDRAWTGLPKTDANGNTISYRAVEVNPVEGYTASYSEIKSNGNAVITNTYNYITISAHKVWSNLDKSETAPDGASITFKLQRKSGNGGTWETIKTAELTEAESFACEWSDLPKTDDSGNPYYYRVIEDPVPDNYDASGWDDTGTNVTTDFPITNKEHDFYTKVPIKVVANTGTGWGVTENDLTEIDSVTASDLKNWVSDTVTINGVETDCYIFKWMVKFNESKSNVEFLDQLPENSVLYLKDNSGYELTIKYPNSGSQSFTSDYFGQGYGDVQMNYSQSTNILNVKFVNNAMEHFTYCIAIPKSIVDEEIEANGKYELTNKIKSTDQDDYTESTLTIEQGSDSPVDEDLFTKGYVADSGNSAAKPMYRLFINPEGKNLSNDETLDISDIFEITGYKDKNGNITYGSDLLDVNLSDVTVYECDQNGNPIRILSESEYSYLVDTDDSVETNTVDYKSSLSSGEFNSYSSGSYWFRAYSNKYLKDLEVVVEVEGTPGEAVNPRVTVDGVTVRASSTVYTSNGEPAYDGSGKAQLIVSFSKDYNGSGDGFTVSTDNATSTNITLVSAKLVQTTVSTKTNVTLTVPDEMYLRIDYRYKLRTNSRTPSVLNGDAEVGAVPPNGDTVYMKNEAALHTNSGDVSDDAGDTSFVVNSSSGTSEAKEYPNITKVNIGNTSLKLKANFKLAKYDPATQKWCYATDFTASGESHEIEYSDNVTEQNNLVPADAADLVVDGVFNINFEEGVLYKLIETAAPTGYKSTGWSNQTENGYYTIPTTEMEEFTYYFVYNGNVSDLPDGLDQSKVQSVSLNGTLEVKNTELIDIGASKSWSSATDPTINDSVDLQLWWSYKKSSTIPDDAVKATADDLGLANLTANYTLRATDELIWRNDAIWTGLPNGINGKPIYYYVKEVSYTFGGNTYTVNDDGTSSGPFEPIYSGNALNGDGVVSITNSQGLLIQKLWKNSANESMKDTAIPVDEIGFELYGIKDGVQTLIYTGKLEAASDWKFMIPSDVDLSGYDSFKIKEVDTENVNVALELYGYTISDIYNLNGEAGIITLTNKNNLPTNIDVTVNKVWSDGDSAHVNDSITVKLYQSSRMLTSSEVSGIKTGTMPDGVSLVEISGINNTVTLNSSNWSYTWSNLPYKDDGVSRYYYYPVETDVSISGSNIYVADYSRIDQASLQRITINNSIPGGLTIEKKWKNSNGEEITPEVTAVNLDIYKKAIVTTETTSSAETTATTTTTATSQPVKIMALGDSITDGYWTGSSDGYRKYLYYALTQAGYNIDMVGSKSGGNSWDDSNANYTTSDGITISYDGNHDGHSQAYISSKSGQYWNLYDIIKEGSGTAPNTIKNNDPDIVLLLIGTNDIMGAGQYGNVLDVATYEDRLKELIDEIYKQKPNVQLIIMSPPPIYADYSTADWLNGHQSEMDSNITNCITAIKNVVDYYNNNQYICKYLDLNSEFSKNAKYTDYTVLLEDYCHPSDIGYHVMGDFIANELITSYFGGTVTNPVEPEIPEPIGGLPTDFYGTGGEVNSDYEFVKTVTVKSDENWRLTLSDLAEGYVYYVVEPENSGWTASYMNNGQVISDSGNLITVTNTKQIEQTSITVKKQWFGDAASGINLTLQRKAGEDGEWEDYKTQTLTGSGSAWTYTWNELDKTDAGGALYYYRVVEEAVSGYNTVYSNNDGLNGNTSDNPIVITNIKLINLKLKKLWANDSEPTVGTVDVEIHRSTEQSDVPEVTTISVTTGAETTTTTATTTTTTTTKGSDTTTTTTTTTITTTTTTTTTTVTTTTTTTTSSVGGSTTTTTTTQSSSGGKVTLDDNTLSIELDSSNIDQTKTVESISIEFDSNVVASTSWSQVYIAVYDENGNCNWEASKYVGVYGGGIAGDASAGNTYTLNVGSKVSKVTVETKDGISMPLISYTITYADASPQALTYSHPPVMQQLAALNLTLPTISMQSASDPTYVKTITLKNSDGSNWQAIAQNLPAYDENGNKYYYWVEEVSVPGYTASYSFDDGDGDTVYCINAANAGNAEATIKNTPTESSSVIMPSTGGEGTTWYYITGMAIMLSSTAAYILIKRRRERAVK